MAERLLPFSNKDGSDENSNDEDKSFVMIDAEVIERIKNRVIEDGRFNTFRNEWDENLSIQPMTLDRLRFCLFQSLISTIGERITALDLWHPLDNENVPDWCQPRSELFSAPQHGLEIINIHCRNLRSIAICSCVMMFHEDQLYTTMQNNAIHTLYVRGDLKTYSFLDDCMPNMFVLHLEMPVVAPHLLVPKLLNFRKLDKFVLRCGSEIVKSAPYSADCYRKKKDTDVTLEVNVDVMAACKI